MENNLNNYPNDYPGGGEKIEQPKSTKRNSGFLGGFLCGLLVCMFVVSCIYTGVQFHKVYQMQQERKALQDGTAEPEQLVNDMTMSKLEIIEETISDYYYEEDVDVQDMIDGMYMGVVASLGDPYSTYYSEEDLKELMEQTEGIYYGIGAYVSMDMDTMTASISGVIDDTPAQEAGLRDGDILYMVDGELMQGYELSEVVARIKGEEGTFVHLTIYREGESDYLEFDVERRKIESPTVTYEMYEDGIGYIQIAEFGDITVDQFTEAMEVLNGQGMKGLILDLRANPGGNLSAVVDISRQLLPEGLIVYTEDRDGNRTEYACDGKNEFDKPMVVLINGYSASASEILAGAIKDYGIGELIGTTTYGKGIVQKVISLSDNTAVKLTVSSYFTPNGNNIHGIGIEPDEVYEFDSERYYEEEYDNQLEHAKEVMHEKIAALQE